jgi:predicted cation transporter
LEVFLFIMGVLAVTIAGFWSPELVMEAIEEPILKGIVPAVLIAGLLFYYGRTRAQKAMATILDKVSIKIIIFFIIVVLGLVSSVITAIIASLLLVELVNCMPLDRKTKINLVIIACFSIGLGAVLTPIGEPLSTIAITKLQGEPYYADFFFLFNLLAIFIIPGVVAMGLLGVFFAGKKSEEACMTVEANTETIRDVFVRAAKVYVFVMALLLLGAGMKILIDKYLLSVPPTVLYWVNMISAILDNATLTAAEISPNMEITQIKAVLMGLLISGGMLIPGNIPNIISAGKLGITSNEWAKLGVPLGLILMILFFVWIFYIPFYVQFNL